LLVIDAHNHIAPEPVPSMVTTFVKITSEELISKMDRSGIDKAVIFGAGPYIDKQMNARIVKAQKQNPDRFISFARVNPYEGEKAASEVERLVREHGMKGLKLHPGFQSFKIDGKFTLELLEKIAKLRIPIIFHTGDPPHLCHPSQVAPLADRCPDIPLILGHTGEIYFGFDAIRVAKKFDNVYLETSWSPKATIELALKEVGSNKILMGTDNPYSDYQIEIKKLEVIKMSEQDRIGIKGGNLAKLLKL